MSEPAPRYPYLVWSLVQTERLSRRVLGALADASNRLWLSPISVWEFMLLAERGRVRLEGSMAPDAWGEVAFRRAPLHDAPLNREVAIRSQSVGLEHDDPDDRFLAATAAVYELTLVTSDERLLRGTGFQILAN